MSKNISSTQKSYLAGFLDGDGSIYVRLKPNKSYKYGFQIAPYIVFFQSNKERLKFQKICDLIQLGYVRKRKDGILEYIISRQKSIIEFLCWIKPYVIIKKQQVALMEEILKKKETINDSKDFSELMQLIDKFRELNYSKKRKRHILTP